MMDCLQCAPLTQDLRGRSPNILTLPCAWYIALLVSTTVMDRLTTERPRFPVSPQQQEHITNQFLVAST